MSPLVSEGISLAMYGMGTVFTFLTVLIVVTQLMSWLVLRLQLEDPQQTETALAKQKKLAAITAAVHQHQHRQQQ
ncbi:MAG: OadG family protein [Pseudomonadales bacterium]|nr:OadG family protein [Pseudomonadales bacterium]MBO7006571.1 OadG family protein [Pseudomonadales bacterium]